MREVGTIINAKLQQIKTKTHLKSKKRLMERHSGKAITRRLRTAARRFSGNTTAFFLIFYLFTAYK